MIAGWHVSYLSANSTRIQPDADPQVRLNRTGDNLANVIQYLNEQHLDCLEAIFATLRRRALGIERVLAEALSAAWVAKESLEK